MSQDREERQRRVDRLDPEERIAAGEALDHAMARSRCRGGIEHLPWSQALEDLLVLQAEEGEGGDYVDAGARRAEALALKRQTLEQLELAAEQLRAELSPEGARDVRVYVRPPGKRDGRYWVLRAYYPDGGEVARSSRVVDPEGKGAQTKEDALRIARAWEAELRGEVCPFGEVARAYLADVEARLAAGELRRSSATRYRQDLEAVGAVLERVDAAGVRLAIERLREKGYSPGTIAKVMVTARAAWSHAIERGLVAASDRWPKVREFVAQDVCDALGIKQASSKPSQKGVHRVHTLGVIWYRVAAPGRPHDFAGAARYPTFAQADDARPRLRNAEAHRLSASLGHAYLAGCDCDACSTARSAT